MKFHSRWLLLILFIGPFTIASRAQTTIPITQAPSTGTQNTGFPVMVRVQLNGTSITGAHITATTTDGIDVGSGDTDSSGVVKLTLPVGDYIFIGISGDKRGTAKAHVESSLTIVILELAPATVSPQ